MKSAFVRAVVDKQLKIEVSLILSSFGLSTSRAIELFMAQV